MTLPAILKDNFRLPVVAAPLFIISHPPLVMAQCKAGVMGSFPALNARPEAQLDEWLAEITEGLADHNAKNPDCPAAPFAVNQIVHRSNKRLEHDLTMCVKYKVPVVISSLGAVPEVNAAIHSYGGIVLHDIINNRQRPFRHRTRARTGPDSRLPRRRRPCGPPVRLFGAVQENRGMVRRATLFAVQGSISTGVRMLRARVGAGRPPRPWGALAYDRVSPLSSATDVGPRPPTNTSRMIVDSEA